MLGKEPPSSVVESENTPYSEYRFVRKRHIGVRGAQKTSPPREGIKGWGKSQKGSKEFGVASHESSLPLLGGD